MSALFRLCFFCVRSPIYFCFVSPCFLILSPLFFFVSRFPFRRLRFFFSLSLCITYPRTRLCVYVCFFFLSDLPRSLCSLLFLCVPRSAHLGLLLSLTLGPSFQLRKVRVRVCVHTSGSVCTDVSDSVHTLTLPSFFSPSPLLPFPVLPPWDSRKVRELGKGVAHTAEAQTALRTEKSLPFS